jgi:type I protein arginine methyltransferase
MLIEFHRRMLADRVRSAAFRKALEQVIRPGHSVVADIGAGTGFLGLMARQMGAREIHLIEHGPVIGLAERIAARNGLDGATFWPANSAHILDPPPVDVVVCEVLGNLAFEENAIETLADARRFLRPGGVMIPNAIEQFLAPVTTPRLHEELCSWDDTGTDFDFADAKSTSFDNVYVKRFAPEELLYGESGVRSWDRAVFSSELSGHRQGGASWRLEAPVTVYGFALWWCCELVPGIDLSTSPFSAPTHWDQVYLPVMQPIEGRAADEIAVEIESETGGDEGIGFRWVAVHRRDGREVARESRDLGRGYVGL